MADNTKGSLFTRLTKLFRSGPVVRRKVRDFTQKSSSSTLEVFRKAHSDIYNATLSSYGAFDRMSRISDFSEMESTPEIGSALDIFSEEVASSDDKGRVLHIYSENAKVQEILSELFYEILNIDFNLPMWTRNLCKYGDFFTFLDVSPEYGVTGMYPIAINEIEREEGFSAEDPTAVRFRWITKGNTVLENWQVAHFRLLGNDAFLPYGTSVLESARRIWRQLILMEDAMLVYRVVRAPERRVFYIDVGNIPPEEIENYMQQAQTSLKRAPVVDKTTGKMDLRFNPHTVLDDYFLPVRGGETGTKIDTLAGGTNAAAIEDVTYLQNKLFAALKIPKAYLTYTEDVGSKATLAQQDIRFSRTINRIQKTIVAELNKIAMIHLYIHGFSGDDLAEFTLRLTNPSSVAQQQKLELIRSKFEIAALAPEGLVNREWIRKNIVGLTDEEIDYLKHGRIQDKEEDLEVEAAKAPGSEEAGSAGGGEFGGETGGAETGGGEAGGATDLFAGEKKLGNLLTARSARTKNSEEDDQDEESFLNLSVDDEDAPEKVLKKINAFGGPITPSRKVRNGPASTHMPDFAKMVSGGRGQDTMNKPFDEDFLFGTLPEDKHTYVKPTLSSGIENMLSRMDSKIFTGRRSLLSEGDIVDDFIDEDQNGEA